MTNIETTRVVKTVVSYDTEKYNAVALVKITKELRNSLRKHKNTVNEFLRQFYFANHTRLGKASKELENDGYTKEITSAFNKMIVYFKWMLPEQSLLDSYDYALTAEKKEENEEKKKGIEAVLALLNKKSSKGKADERAYWLVALKAVESSVKKEAKENTK